LQATQEVASPRRHVRDNNIYHCVLLCADALGESNAINVKTDWKTWPRVTRNNVHRVRVEGLWPRRILQYVMQLWVIGKLDSQTFMGWRKRHRLHLIQEGHEAEYIQQ
jgi:hypothetical protein